MLATRRGFFGAFAALVGGAVASKLPKAPDRIVSALLEIDPLIRDVNPRNQRGLFVAFKRPTFRVTCATASGNTIVLHDPSPEAWARLIKGAGIVDYRHWSTS